MALGTKEDGHSSSTYIIYLYSSDYTVQTFLVRKFASLDNSVSVIVIPDTPTTPPIVPNPNK